MNNPLYPGGVGTSQRAFAHELKAAPGWKVQVARLNPVLALIMAAGLNFNKGMGVIKGPAPRITLPIAYDKVPGINTATYAKTPAQQVPTGPVNYLVIDGATHAAYEIVYTEIPWAITPNDKVLLNGGQMGDKEDLALKMALIKDAKVIDDWLGGSANSSQSNLMGLRYMLSTSNSPGGINQTTADYWRAQVSSGVGNGSETTIMSMRDNIAQVTNEMGMPVKPDLLLASGAVGGAFSVFNEIRGFVDPYKRLVEKSGEEAKYTFDHFEYMGMLVAQDSKVANQCKMLTTDTLYYFGDNKPKISKGTVDGTETDFRVMSAFRSFGTNMPAANGLMDGWTS